MPTTRVGASSAASWRVRWINAAFVRLYVPSRASARMPPTDAMLTITPGSSRMARFHADWHQNTGPRMFTWNVLSKRDGSMPIVGPAYGLAAALLTRISSRPKRSMVAATQPSPASMSPALAANTAVSPPISAAAASRPSILRDESITLAPDSTKPAAMALPIPREPPVTRATLPSSRISMEAARYWLPCRHGQPSGSVVVNRLAGESSPYLRQHQDNPVDWYPWGAEAFAKARDEDK